MIPITEQEKQQIENYIQDNYPFAVFKLSPSSKLFKKLSHIKNGTLQGQSYPISIQSLLDVWGYKQDEIRFIRHTNVAIEDAIQMLNYDLSIVVNNYHSYLRQYEGHKINILETEEFKEIAKSISKRKNSFVTHIKNKGGG